MTEVTRPTSPWADEPTLTRHQAVVTEHERYRAIHELFGRTSVLYAIRTRDGLIKLGCTQNLAERRRKVGGQILAVIPGGYFEELRMHNQLKADRARRREWYHPTLEVLRVVNMMRAISGIEPLGE